MNIYFRQTTKHHFQKTSQMNKSISLKAILFDIQHMLKQTPYTIRNFSLALCFVWVFIIEGGLLTFGFIVLGTIALHFKEYFLLKKKETSNEVLFFQKKKNERKRNLYIFFTMMFLVWIFREESFGRLFSLGIGLVYLVKYLFFIPSIVFKAEDYSLLIEKGFKRSRIDFTYTNKIRFVSNRMIFENVLDKKIVIDDIKYLPKMDELKEFLTSNFGREKVVSAANGQSLI